MVKINKILTLLLLFLLLVIPIASAEIVMIDDNPAYGNLWERPVLAWPSGTNASVTTRVYIPDTNYFSMNWVNKNNPSDYFGVHINKNVNGIGVGNLGIATTSGYIYNGDIPTPGQFSDPGTTVRFTATIDDRMIVNVNGVDFPAVSIPGLRQNYLIFKMGSGIWGIGDITIFAENTNILMNQTWNGYVLTRQLLTQ